MHAKLANVDVVAVSPCRRFVAAPNLSLLLKLSTCIYGKH